MTINQDEKTAQCLKENQEKILNLWTEVVRREIPAASSSSDIFLKDALPLFLNNLVRALSPFEPDDKKETKAVSKEHGVQRSQNGDYDLGQVLTEYKLLQRAIFEVLEVEMGAPLTRSARDTILDSVSIGIRAAGVEFSNRHLENLKLSNEALSNFGFTAAHDLQEPLRMVASHLTLLNRKLDKDLPEDVQQHFDFAIDGANRMKALIDSLLVYSQVGRTEEKAKPTDFNLILQNATANLQKVIRECNAEIIAEHLPTLPARPVEVERLFQNLLSNSLKYRSERDPLIKISATEAGSRWIFSVTDNGIGIKEGQEERIFKLFTRLHSRISFPGSGIGLSICRRVVELHGGSIWCEPNSEGATIKFSIPSKNLFFGI